MGFVLCGHTAPAQADPPPVTEPVEIESVDVREGDDLSAGAVVRPSDHPQADSVEELLLLSPGVAIRDSGASGVGVSLRGTDPNQTLIVLDDVPLNLGLGGVDLRQMSLDSLGRLDLHRGGSALFGAHAIGGALVMNSRETPRGAWSFVGTSLDSLGEMATRAGWGHGTASGGGFATVSIRNAEGDFAFEDSNGAARIRENNDRLALHFSGRGMRLVGDSSRITWTLHHHQENRGSPGVEQFPTRSARMDDLFNVAVIQWATHDAWRGGDVRAAVWHQLRHSHHQDPAPQLPPGIDNEHLDQRVGGHVELDWRGGEWSSLRTRVESATEWAAIRRSEVHSRPTRTRLGWMLSEEMVFWDELLQLLAGVRLDWNDDTGAKWIPRAGVLVRPNRHIAIRLNGSRAYRPPSFEELHFDAGHVRGNPDLGPEDAWSVDAALELEWKRFGARVGAFHLAIENLILFLPKTAFVFEADNSQSAISQGMESEMWWRPFQSTEIRGQWTWMDARFVDTELALPARSPHRFSALIRQKFHGLDAFVSVGWQEGFFLDRFEQLSEESRWMVNGGMRYRPVSWVDFGITGRNLLDKRDAVDSLQQPLPGRSVQLSLAFHFEERANASD